MASCALLLRRLATRGRCAAVRPGVASAPRRRLTAEADILALSKRSQTGVSLRGLVDAGQNHLALTPDDPSQPTKVLLTIASFLHHELPIRLARRVVELDGLPGLHGMASVRRVRDSVREWYATSAAEILAADRPTDGASERAFAQLLETIYERHAGVLYTMAQGAFELRARVGERGAAGAAFEDDASIHGLDSFYTSRIGIRMIIGQYVALRSPVDDRPDSRVVGLFNTAVNPAVIAEDARAPGDGARERQFGVAPAVKIIGRTDLDLTRARRRRARGHQVIVADGEDNEDVALKISDEGGGIARSDLRRVWSYLYTTASADVQRGASTTTARTSGAPLAGLGYGLPISRAYARYFGGDLTLMSMEGFGTDAFVYLSRLGDHDEPLP
ncbi:acetyl-transferring pyruvate dehydrogenase kinase [Aureococcus anophagefferens]|uniref:Protein-serine/threonine kinase n=1 Tax=Aureococcus anophagefferens TaxID=44056 RepID=A0ABR1G9M8_AURAN